jgi:hypothetical protein
LETTEIEDSLISTFGDIIDIKFLRLILEILGYQMQPISFSLVLLGPACERLQTPIAGCNLDLDAQIAVKEFHGT